MAVLKRRWRKFRALLAYRYFLKFYYGERLRDYPLRVAIKLLLSRFVFVSQLPLLLPEKHFLVNYHGAKMYINLFLWPSMMDRALGVYEYWKTKLVCRLVKEEMTIIDIGAHKGNYSVLFATLMHDRGRVLAFEPDPDNCYWLRKNIEVNNYKCIELHQCALSDKEGSATFYPANGMGSLVRRPALKTPSQKEPIPVQTRTLDNVLNEEHIHDVDIIKMDVEGHDLSVLRGAQHTLTKSNNVKLLMDVDVFTNAERKELFEFLKSCGFQIYRIGSELKPVERANELFLFGEGLKPTPIKRHQTVREVYATKAP